MPNVLSLFPFVCFWNFKLLEPPSLLKNKKHLVGTLPRLQQAYVHLKIHSEEKFAWEPDSSFKRKRNAKSTWIEHSMGRFQSRAAWVLVVLAWWVDKIWTASLLFVFKELLIFTSVCSPWRRSRSLPCQRYRTHSWKDQVQPKNHLRCAIFDLRWVEKSPWVATWVVAGVRMAGLANLN